MDFRKSPFKFRKDIENYLLEIDRFYLNANSEIIIPEGVEQISTNIFEGNKITFNIKRSTCILFF